MYKLSKAIDLVGGKEFDVKNNKLKLDVGGIGYLILKLFYLFCRAEDKFINYVDCILKI
jgi:hypothetical protein